MQLGLVEDKPVKLKNVNKPMRGHFEKTGGGHAADARPEGDSARRPSRRELNVGDKVLVDLFADGDTIEVVGKLEGARLRGHDQASQLQPRPRDRTVR